MTCDKLYIGVSIFPSNFSLYFLCCSLHDLRDNGVLKRLRVQWWKPQLPQVKSPWFTVDLYSVTPIFVLLAAGVTIAGVLLVLERKWHQHQHTEPCELPHGNSSSKISFSKKFELK
jgi:hypothetical protein